jgi:transcriptional regulator with XRE-family HTH domain
MAGQAESPQQLLGAIIRAQREFASLPMRQFAAAVGISKPYLSQIELGLRAPSERVLEAIAESLETSADALYTEAGFVEAAAEEGVDRPVGLETHIESAGELTAAQRRALIEIYRGFVDANAVRRARGSREGK